jgi:hypothetical protein
MEKPCRKESTYKNGIFGTEDCHGQFTPAHKAAVGSESPGSGAAQEQVPSAASIELYASEVQYEVWRQKHTERIFAWQFYSSLVLFLVVLALVAAGLYFAYMQFKLSFHTADSKFEKEEVTLSAHGLVLKSSFLGVVILAFSLAFFFLYLRYVYPISATDPGQSVATGAAKQ